MATWHSNKVWQSNRQPTTIQAARTEQEALHTKMIETARRLGELYGPSEDHQAALDAFYLAIPENASKREIITACENQIVARRAQLDEQARDEQKARDAEAREWELMSVYDDRTAGIDEEIPY